LNFKTITVAERASIGTITLNRPERRNAMTPEMQEELIARNGRRRGQLPCAGAGRRGGGFLFRPRFIGIAGNAKQDAADHRVDAERIARLFRTLYELPIPTIAAVHGPAIAGGPD
jgi:methylglutaconyl-CoA hydratase